MTPISTIAFDLGGVLTSDPWETIILTPERGLAARLEIAPFKAEEIGQTIYPAFACSPSQEKDYWKVFFREARRPFDSALVAEVEEATMQFNPEASALPPLLLQAGLQIAIVTNNSSFWFEKQMKKIDWENYLPQIPLFTSFTYGTRKSDGLNGLYVPVANHFNPETTLVVDDRQGNIDIARSFGFQTLLYKMTDPKPLSAHLAESFAGTKR